MPLWRSPRSPCSEVRPGTEAASGAGEQHRADRGFRRDAPAAVAQSSTSVRSSALSRSGRLSVISATRACALEQKGRILHGARRSRRCPSVPYLVVGHNDAGGPRTVMPIPAMLERSLRLPVVGAPMFIVSTPALVLAQCKAGIVGSFPALNARPAASSMSGCAQITEELAAHRARIRRRASRRLR